MKRKTVFKLAKSLVVNHIVRKMAPPVHTGKWRNLFAHDHVTLPGQAWAWILSYWSGGLYCNKHYSNKRSCARAWPGIKLCILNLEVQNSYTFLCKIWVSNWPSFSALVHTIIRLHTPWSVGRYYLHLDTQLRSTWLWADINRNCNTFFTFTANSPHPILILIIM